jgi:hypothetical protein
MNTIGANIKAARKAEQAAKNRQRENELMEAKP